MKTVFITLGEDIIARNILFTDFWPVLKREVASVTRIVFLVQFDRLEYFRELFKGESDVVVEAYRKAPAGRFESTVMSLARSGINTHTNTWSKMRSWKRGDSSLFVTVFKFLHQITLGNFSWYKRFLRFLILRTGKNDVHVRELYDKYHPSLLCALSLTNYDFDVPIAREAKRRGVRIFGMVRSWDNLSSHGLLRIVPDIFVLQNKFLKEMAHRHQVIRDKKIPIHVIGLPHYDLFLREEFLESREEYFRKNGFDPNKKLILYAGMGGFLFIHEGDIITILEELIQEGLINESVQVMYSAHPKFLSSLERVKAMSHIAPAPRVGYIDLENPNWERELKHTKDLINLIYHSDVLVMGASTLAVDAAALDKSVICIDFDVYGKSLSYWESVKRFYDLYTHFEALVETGGVSIARSKEELVVELNRYLKHPEYRHEGRQSITDLLAAPYDSESGTRLAHLLQQEIESV